MLLRPHITSLQLDSGNWHYCASVVLFHHNSLVLSRPRSFRATLQAAYHNAQANDATALRDSTSSSSFSCWL